MRSPPESRGGGGGGDGGGQEDECVSGENCDLPPGEKARNGSKKGNKSPSVKTFRKNSYSKEFAPTKLVRNPQNAWETRLFNKTSSLPSSCLFFFFLPSNYYFRRFKEDLNLFHWVGGQSQQTPCPLLERTYPKLPRVC